MASKISGRKPGRPPKPTTPHNPRSNVIVKPDWFLARNELDVESSPARSVGNLLVDNSFTQYSAKRHVSVTPILKRGRKPGKSNKRDGKACMPIPCSLTKENDLDLDQHCHDSGQSSHEEENDSWNDESKVGLLKRKVTEPRSIPGPLPFYLQSDQNSKTPKLDLPESSNDLFVPSHLVLTACAVYEVLRNFSNEVRLSPFPIEHFSVALLSEEMTPLLAEVHIQLLKAMLREEDVQQTCFVQKGQTDSMNSILLFDDTFTWPEVMRHYFQSDPSFAPALSILESCDYPFTTCDVRLSLLKFITDHFLCHTATRGLLSDGYRKDNNHCRVCRKVGDVLCCDTCPAVYHLHCLNPPLKDVPNEKWQCPVCIAQSCKGVTDCKNGDEQATFVCRRDCLGYDRHGRKYWFIARRIFVEETVSCEEFDAGDEERKTWYYSSPHQFEQLLKVLDKQKFEKKLYQVLTKLRSEILRQMAITVEVTNKLKGTSKSYLQANSSKGAVKEKIKKSASATSKATDEVFKLGLDNGQKSYVNHYSNNPLALNRKEALEEMDKKRYMSQTFSFTDCSEFKWSDSPFGNVAIMLQTIRQTLLQLHSKLPAIFLHPDWSSMRTSWITAVHTCVSSVDLGRVLSTLAANILPVVFKKVWHKSLGHIRLRRQTAQECEERKKIKMQEKYDKELKEQMHRLHIVHYTKVPKLNILKHKGEEFRLHGQWAWRWISATRPFRKLDATQCGLRAGPWRIVTCSPEENGTSHYVQCEPEVDVEMYKIPSCDPAMEVVDVCAAMNDADRRVYPKIAKKGKLDSMLDEKSTQEKNLRKVHDNKYPMVSSYMNKSIKRTIFVLPDHELRYLARRYGQGYVQGFHHGYKKTSTYWIYPSARPMFKTCWFFRTNSLQSLSAAALQLRILWACIRWDDLAAKANCTASGKVRTKTDTETVTTQLLRHRYVGRFLERTVYLERRVVTPLDAAKKDEEENPSQSNVRKRMSAPVPKPLKPIMTEEWVDEDQLDLPVIIHYHKRMEKLAAAVSVITSTSEIRPTTLEAKPSHQGSRKPPTTKKLQPQVRCPLSVQKDARELKKATSGTALNKKVHLQRAETVEPLVEKIPESTASPLDRQILIKRDESTLQEVVETTAAAAQDSDVQSVLNSPSTSAAADATDVQILKFPNGDIKVRGLQPGQQIARIAEGRYAVIPKMNFAVKYRETKPKVPRQQTPMTCIIDSTLEKSAEQDTAIDNFPKEDKPLPTSTSQKKRGRKPKARRKVNNQLDNSQKEDLTPMKGATLEKSPAFDDSLKEDLPLPTSTPKKKREWKLPAAADRVLRSSATCQKSAHIP